LPTLRGFFQMSRAGKIDQGQNPLMWSSLLLPYIESLWTARQLDLSAEVVYTVAERIYTSMDRRNPDASAGKRHLGWPGVSCEVWFPEGAGGGEGYGWGAVMPAHIIRNLLGIRETDHAEHLMITPNIPEAFQIAGRAYGVDTLPLKCGPLSISYKLAEQGAMQITGKCGSGAMRVENAESGARISTGVDGKFSFNGQNRQSYRLTITR